MLTCVCYVWGGVPSASLPSHVPHVFCGWMLHGAACGAGCALAQGRLQSVHTQGADALPIKVEVCAWAMCACARVAVWRAQACGAAACRPPPSTPFAATSASRATRISSSCRGALGPRRGRGRDPELHENPATTCSTTAGHTRWSLYAVCAGPISPTHAARCSLEHHIRSELDATSPRALAVLRPLKVGRAGDGGPAGLPAQCARYAQKAMAGLAAMTGLALAVGRWAAAGVELDFISWFDQASVSFAFYIWII
jgi:hypothetical protein